MRKGRTLAGVLAVTMVLGSSTLPESMKFYSFGVDAQAAETVDSGTCGDDLTWVLDDEGTLTISGSGDMENYEDYVSSPWYGREDIFTIVIGDDVTSIGDNAFYKCYSLTSCTIGNSVASIGNGSFFGCWSWDGGLTSIEIPDSVTSIGDSAFDACHSLTSVKISDSVTSIGDYAFLRCNLTSIEIPDSVTSIGYEAFGYGYNDWLEIVQIEGFIVYGYNGSAAETYAEENGFTFIAPDEIAIGDVNLDGSIDYLDAMTALRYDAELIDLSDEQLVAGDVNNDGSVDSLDAILILRYDAGLIESFE